MKTLIVANWKMNPSTKKEAKKLFDSVRKSTKGIKNIEVVICPPFVYLSLFSGLKLGAQNVFYLSADRQVKKSGAFTGEVSPLMLKDLGVEYVIIGHSESRKYLNETDELIRKIISKLYNREIADTTKIIYGGSVDSKNTNSYITQTGVNGLLVGGASLNAEEFIEIIKSL